MFAGTRLSADGPDFPVATYFQLNRIKWSGRWAIQNISGLCIESAIVARTLKPLMRALEVNRTRKMCALLSEGVKFTIERADENC